MMKRRRCVAVRYLLQILQIRILFYVMDNRRIPNYTPHPSTLHTAQVGPRLAGGALVSCLHGRFRKARRGSDRIGSRFILRRETPRVSEAEPSSHSTVDHSITALEYAAYRPPRPHERAPTLADTEGENEWNDAPRVEYREHRQHSACAPPVIFPDTPHSRSPEDANMSMHML